MCTQHIITPQTPQVSQGWKPETHIDFRSISDYCSLRIGHHWGWDAIQFSSNHFTLPQLHQTIHTIFIKTRWETCTPQRQYLIFLNISNSYRFTFTFGFFSARISPHFSHVFFSIHIFPWACQFLHFFCSRFTVKVNEAGEIGVRHDNE